MSFISLICTNQDKLKNEKSLTMLNDKIKAHEEEIERLSYEVAKLQKEHEIRYRIDEMELTLQSLRLELKNKQQFSMQKENNISKIKQKIKKLKNERQELRTNINYYNNRMKNIQTSHSWRYTAFFRKLMRVFKH